MHNKCNALESSRNHPPRPWSLEKLSSTKPVPGTKKVGDRWCRGSQAWSFELQKLPIVEDGRYVRSCFPVHKGNAQSRLPGCWCRSSGLSLPKGKSPEKAELTQLLAGGTWSQRSQVISECLLFHGMRPQYTTE